MLICDLEYGTVKGAMRWLARHRGVEVIEIEHRHPASFDSLLASLPRRLRALSAPQTDGPDPRHPPHWAGDAGQAIAAAAREHGVDVILDGAHALGQIEFDLEDWVFPSLVSICRNGSARR